MIGTNRASIIIRIIVDSEHVEDLIEEIRNWYNETSIPMQPPIIDGAGYVVLGEKTKCQNTKF